MKDIRKVGHTESRTYRWKKGSKEILKKDRKKKGKKGKKKEEVSEGGRDKRQERRKT